VSRHRIRIKHNVAPIKVPDQVRSKPTRSNWVRLFILPDAFITCALNTPKYNSKERLFSLFQIRNNGGNNRGEATALMKLMLETLPKIYLLPTRDSMGTIRKRCNSSSIASLQRAQTVWYWTSRLWRLNLVGNGKEWSARICRNEGGGEYSSIQGMKMLNILNSRKISEDSAPVPLCWHPYFMT
jgi:hypothetical protein